MGRFSGYSTKTQNQPTVDQRFANFYRLLYTFIHLNIDVNRAVGIFGVMVLGKRGWAGPVQKLNCEGRETQQGQVRQLWQLNQRHLKRGG